MSTIGRKGATDQNDSNEEVQNHCGNRSQCSGHRPDDYNDYQCRSDLRDNKENGEG